MFHDFLGLTLDEQVEELERVGLKAVYLDADSVSNARTSSEGNGGSKLFSKVKQCEYSVVIVSPERLASPEFNCMVRNDWFRQNLVQFVIDEAHIVVPWSKGFRLPYGNISRVGARLPTTVPALAMTATSQANEEQALLRLLGFREGHYKTTRLSCDQANLQLVFLTLTHGLAGPLFPDIAWVAEGRWKTIIYCHDVRLVNDIVSYLWQLRPGNFEQRKRNIRQYSSYIPAEDNRKTIHDFDNDPETFVIVATIKLALGVDVRKAQVCIILGLADTVEQDKQEKGRAGRERDTDAVGITYVEKRGGSDLLKEVQAEREAEEAALEVPQGSGALEMSASNGPDVDEDGINEHQDDKEETKTGKNIDPGLRRLVKAHVARKCLNAETNRIFGEIGPKAFLSCHEAQRRLPCSSCITREPYLTSARHLFAAETQEITRRALEFQQPDSAMPEDHILQQLLSESPTTPHYKPLTAAMQKTASEAFDQFSFSRWALKLGNIRNTFLPHTAHIPGDVFNRLLKYFHLIRDREALAIVCGTDWEYLEDDGPGLTSEIKRLNTVFDQQHADTAAAKNAKAAETRKRKAAEKAVGHI